MIVATFLVFFGVERSIRGGFRTVILPAGLSPESPRGRELIEEWNLDGNIFVRYFRWLGDALQGDLGRSTRAGTSVWDLISPRLSISLEIMFVATALTLLLGIPLGLWAAQRAHNGRGAVLTVMLSLSQSAPVFITPLFMSWLFAVKLGWLPAAGWVRISTSVTGNLKGIAMPVAALVLAEVGVVGRVIRADALRILKADFVTSAIGKGLGVPYVMFRHVLRPASLGLLNVVGINIGALLSGALIVELIFGIGGLGQLLLESTLNRDLNLLLGLTVYTVGIYVAMSVLVDAVMLAVDPRIRRPE